MHGNANLRAQRNRLYDALREQGASGSQVLEESRKLDALVLRYYRTAAGAVREKPLTVERNDGLSDGTETYGPGEEETLPVVPTEKNPEP